MAPGAIDFGPAAVNAATTLLPCTRVCPSILGALTAQVSQLTYRASAAESAAAAADAEVAQLRGAAAAAARERAQREEETAELRASLRAAEEKVGALCPPRFLPVLDYDYGPIVGC